MKTVVRMLLKILYVMTVGTILAVVGFWIGGVLFPSNNHDLSDITQGFLQLGIALVGLVVGLVVGSVTVKHFKRAKV